MKPAISEALRRFGREERGPVIVEMALVLPLFTLFLLTIVDLGLVMREYQVVQNAVREGARQAIHPLAAPWSGVPTATIETIVRQRVVTYMSEELGPAFPAPAASTVVVVRNEAVPAADGTTLIASRITVTYNRSLLIAGGGLLPFPQVTLTASAAFKNLY